MKAYFLTSAVLLFLTSSCTTVERLKQLRAYENKLSDSSQEDTTLTDITADHDSQGRQALLLSAFYGLDDALPRGANRGICEGAGGADGMPVIFSHEIDFATLDAGDLRVTTASGEIGEISCVTLAPADDTGELRTVLLAGHFGSIDDQPVLVEVTGNLLSKDNSVNFKGSSIEVTPLEDGPTMVWAEIVPEDQWDVGKEATALPWGGSSGAPEGTKQVVRVSWAGGVTKPGGKEVDEKEGVLYRVTVLLEDGSKIEVTPFALADMGDGDNNHELCLDVEGKPLTVFFPAGYMTDPREDLNPDSRISILK